MFIVAYGWGLLLIASLTVAVNSVGLATRFYPVWVDGEVLLGFMLCCGLLVWLVCVGYFCMMLDVGCGRLVCVVCIAGCCVVFVSLVFGFGGCICLLLIGLLAW